jgi:hypothetical protein
MPVVHANGDRNFEDSFRRSQIAVDVGIDTYERSGIVQTSK